MRDLVLNHNLEETIAVEQNIFIRDKQDWTIRTETMLKQVYDKRILFENFETLIRAISLQNLAKSVLAS
jgi:hypothetical protein